MFEGAFQFSRSYPYSSYFEMIGYETVNLVISLGTIFLVALQLLAMAFLLFVLKFLRYKLGGTNLLFRLEKKIRANLFFNGVLRFFIEGCLELFITSFIVVTTWEWSWKSGDIIG